MPEPTSDAFEDSHHRGDEPHLLREVLRTYQVLMSGFARETGMPASRFGLMRLLAVLEKRAGTTDLARHLGINPAAVTRQIQDMEREGLIRRHGDTRDGRRSYVSLSPKGMRVFEAIHARTHELERSLASALGAEAMRSAATVLAKLRTVVESRR
jgi:DNA-binding MarR family transcriptional regulator